MTVMEPFTREYRLQADSLKAITTAYERALLDLREELDVEKRALNGGPFLNALVCRFLEMAPGDRVRHAREALAALARFRGAGDQAEPDPAPPAPPKGYLPVIAVRDETEAHARRQAERNRPKRVAKAKGKPAEKK